MIVDLLRACYRAPVRFFADDPRTTEITWYFVPKTRPVLPYPTVFGSQQWEADGVWDRRALGTADLGEQVAAFYPWTNGRDLWGAGGLHACGPARDWAEGDSGPTLPPPSGLLPPCCLSLAAFPAHQLSLLVEGDTRSQAASVAVALLKLVASGVAGRGRAVGDTPLLSLAASAASARGRAVLGEHALSLLATAGLVRGRAVTASGVLALLASSLTARGRTSPGSLALALLATGSTGRGVSRTGLPTLALQVVSVPSTGGVQGFSPGCSHVTHSPKQVKVTIAGVTNGTCTDCANLNGTFLLTCPSNGACNWVGPNVTLCGGSTPIAFASLGGNTWQVSVGPLNPAFNVTLAGNWDGTSTLTLNRVSSASCSLPATCTVAPA